MSEDRIRRERTNGPGGVLPSWWAERLGLLLDALGEVPVSAFERASLTIVAGDQPLVTVLHLAALLRRAREAAPGGEPR